MDEKHDTGLAEESDTGEETYPESLDSPATGFSNGVIDSERMTTPEAARQVTPEGARAPRSIYFPPEIWYSILSHLFKPWKRELLVLPLSFREAAGRSPSPWANAAMADTRFPVQLLRTCRLFHEIARTYIYGRRRFFLQGAAGVRQWAETIGPRNLREIRHIYASVCPFGNLSQEERQSFADDWKFVLSGMRLETLDLRTPPYPTYDVDVVRVMVQLPSLRSLDWRNSVYYQEWGFHGDCPNIEKLTLMSHLGGRHSIRGFLKFFPNLKCLTLRPPREELLVLFQFVTPLTELNWVGWYFHQNLDSLVANHVSTLKVLRLLQLSEADQIPLARALHKLIHLVSLTTQWHKCRPISILSRLPEDITTVNFACTEGGPKLGGVALHLVGLAAKCRYLRILRLSVDAESKECLETRESQDALGHLRSKGVDVSVDLYRFGERDSANYLLTLPEFTSGIEQ